MGYVGLHRSREPEPDASGFRLSHPGLLRQDRVWIDARGRTLRIRAEEAPALSDRHLGNVAAWLEDHACDVWAAYLREYVAPFGLDGRGRDLVAGARSQDLRNWAQAVVTRSPLHRALVAERERRADVASRRRPVASCCRPVVLVLEDRHWREVHDAPRFATAGEARAWAAEHVEPHGRRWMVAWVR